MTSWARCAGSAAGPDSLNARLAIATCVSLINAVAAAKPLPMTVPACEVSSPDAEVLLPGAQTRRFFSSCWASMIPEQAVLVAEKKCAEQ